MDAPDLQAPPVASAFVETWRRVMTDPEGFFAAMPETGGLQEPFTFLAVCAAVNAAGHLLLGWGVPGAATIFAGELLAAIVGAALLVLVAQHLFHGRAGFEPTFRVVAYSAAPSIVDWIPVLGWLARLYRLYLVVRGLGRVQAIEPVSAVLTIVISYAVVAISLLGFGGPWRAWP
jgi:hypothetical protein